MTHQKGLPAQAGFTLIETILYLALFAIVIGGGMAAAYNIIQTTDANSNHVILQEEANFLFRKIDWALTGVTAITANTSTLVTTKPISGVSTQLTFALSVNTITLQRGTGTAVVLNSASIAVSALSFTKTAGGNGKPDSVTAAFSLITAQNGRGASQDFSLTKYLRK